MLYIVATPIGNLKDFSERGKETLRRVDKILCEDTRVTRKLLDSFGIDKKLLTYNDHNASSLVSQIVNEIKNEKTSFALVSDAGTPLISDPGYKLINACLENEIKYTVIPGACSVISALVLSGKPSDRFLFIGFANSKRFSEVSKIDSTIIMFESPKRLLKTLCDIKEFFGDRSVSIVREISKIFEESVHGHCDFLISHFEQTPPKGEIVIVIEPPKNAASPFDKYIPLINELRDKLTLKDLSHAISTFSGISKNKIYDFIKETKND